MIWPAKNFKFGEHAQNWAWDFCAIWGRIVNQRTERTTCHWKDNGGNG